MSYKLRVDKEDIDLNIDRLQYELDGTDSYMDSFERSKKEGQLEVYKSLLQYPMYEDNEWHK